MEPFDTGMLAVGDGHEVYWECVGAPAGLPVLYLHGGPGSGCTPGQRRFVAGERYRGVLFDQRGCGRSRPLASEPDADLRANTTHHLLADIELLRSHLGIDRWAAVVGLSWGSTLGLAYAQAHRDRVGALVLGLVVTTSRGEVDWVTEGVGRLFPEEWHRFREAVPERLRGLRLVDAYAELLFDPDPAVREHAALEWCRWEDAHVSLTPGWEPSLRYEDREFRLRFARLVTHYWRHAAFLEEEQLLRDAATLDAVPGVLIHGRYDVSAPLEIPWRLSRAWATSRLVVLGDAGHGGGDSLTDAITGALAGVTS